MRLTTSRLLGFASFLGFLLAASGLLVGCGGDDSSSPSRAGPGADAGIDAEASVPEDAESDAPAEDAEPGPETSADVQGDTFPDEDGDGVPDSEDVCPGHDDFEDGDGDGIPDGCDACPTGNNDVDSDGDGFPDACDICPGLDESIDTNGSGVPDCREQLRLWLRADTGVFADDGAGAVGAPAADGDLVRRWNDQGVWTAHGNQPDANRQPVFVQTATPAGGPVVRFEGVDGDTEQDDSLDGPALVTGKSARTTFLAVRSTDTASSAILELNRTASSSGSVYRMTPEIAVRVSGGNAVFANQPLDDGLHVITFQNDLSASTSDIRAWYDGIPVSPSSVSARTIDTGAGGYRLGDGHALGSSGFSGDVAEVIVYERTLSETQREAVGMTLERKHGLKTWFVEDPQPLQLYLMAGQSNMVGQGESSELQTPLDTTQGDVMAWMSQAVGWTPLRWGSGNTATQFGPELGFGRTMADADPGARYAIIKHAVNGTSLAVDWNPVSGPVYDDFEQSVTLALQRLDDLGIDYEIRGLLWMQGESDAIEEAMADVYQDNMNAFITNVRTLVGVPEMPVLMGRIRGNMPPPFVYSLAVRMAQESVAAGDLNVKIVDTDSLSLRADGVHYDTEGQLQLGELFAEAVP